MSGGLFASFTFSQLQTELITDPMGVGYSGFLAPGPLSGGDYDGCSKLMNTPMQGSGFTLWRNNIKVNEVVNGIQPTDFRVMTQNQVNRLELLFLGAPINATLAGVRQNFSDVFSGTATLNSGFLTSLAQFQGARTEVLWGTGFFVTSQQVGRAWNAASGAFASGT